MDDEETETPKPSKLKTILPLVGMLVVGLGGGYGASIALAPAAEEEEEGEATEHAAAEEGHGEAAEEAHGEAKEEGHGEKKAEEGGHGEAKADAGGHGEAKADAHGAPAPKKPLGSAEVLNPTITSLGTFTINLKGSGGGRVLRLEVAVDADEAAADQLQVLVPRLRDSVITSVSDYTWSELEGTDGKTRLKDELLTRLNGITDPVRVNAVYLTQFVVS